MIDHNKMRKTIIAGGIIATVANVVIVIAIIAGIIWGINKVSEHGFKNIGERFWNGPPTNTTAISTNACTKINLLDKFSSL